jgi:hypothetical protein
MCESRKNTSPYPFGSKSTEHELAEEIYILLTFYIWRCTVYPESPNPIRAGTAQALNT